MTDARRLLEEAERRPVTGWDFSWLGDRMRTAPLPWSFEEIVAQHVADAPDLLDLETGGGEWLAGLRMRPPRTFATESWPPNVDVARTRLQPLGVTVVAAESAPDNVDQRADETRGRLPFPDASFALISNRHASFVPREVARVLVRGGVFLTQQVGGDYGDFYEALELPRPVPPARKWDAGLAAEQLERVGLRVTDSASAYEETAFADVGALAWYLKAIPWTIPGFSTAANRVRLDRLHERLGTEPLTIRLPAFWLRAEKPD